MAELIKGILLGLGLNQTIFIQAAIFVVFYVVARKIYFGPFLALIQERQRRTVEDRKAAEDLLNQAQNKVEQYEQRINDARSEARSEYERIIADARKEEAAILNGARSEVKALTQEALASVTQHREELRKTLSVEAEKIAEEVTEKLLVKS